MAEPSHPREPHERAHLALCAHDIQDARERLRSARGTGVRSIDVRPLREDLLAALETYAAAITRTGAPVPRVLASEIELYRRLHNTT